MWSQLGKPKLKISKSKIIAYDGHEMHQLGSFECIIEMEKRKYSLATVMVIRCGRNFGPAGEDLLSQDIFHMPSGQFEDNNKYASLTGIKGALATIALYPDATLVDIPARELPLHIKMRVKIELKKMEEAGIIEKVESSDQ